MGNDCCSTVMCKHTSYEKQLHWLRRRSHEKLAKQVIVQIEFVRWQLTIVYIANTRSISCTPIKHNSIAVITVPRAPVHALTRSAAISHESAARTRTHLPSMSSTYEAFPPNIHHDTPDNRRGHMGDITWPIRSNYMTKMSPPPITFNSNCKINNIDVARIHCKLIIRSHATASRSIQNLYAYIQKFKVSRVCIRNWHDSHQIGLNHKIATCDTRLTRIRRLIVLMGRVMQISYSYSKYEVYVCSKQQNIRHDSANNCMLSVHWTTEL